jgi:DNA invertase Pin-like site-specific DNA recombinase
MTTNPLRVLAYVRQSEAQAGEDAATSLSLRSQEDRFRQWCVDNDATPLGVIADHDLRGHDPARPGIRQLLDDAERLQADAVWVLSLSRFARDHIYQELTWRDLQSRGVTHLISAIESGTSDPFVRGIYGLMHAKSRTEMSAHLKGAFARRARDGGFPVGAAPLGYVRPHAITITRANGTSYDRQTGEPVIDPEAAAFVRDLFHRFATGTGMKAIARSLAGETTRHGAVWHVHSLRWILTNPIYVGDIQHTGTIVAHNPAWAIVDRATWDRVQDRIAANQGKRGNRGERKHWLQNLVYHDCGAKAYYQPYGAGRETGYYGCRTHWAPVKCTAGRRTISATILASLVRDCLRHDIGSRPIAATALQMAQDACGGHDAALTRKRAERALASAKDRWKRNHERFSAGKLPPDVMDTEDVLLQESIEKYNSEYNNLPKPPDPDVFARVDARFTSINQLIDVMTEDELRQTLEPIGVVIVGVDGVTIRYTGDAATLIPHPVVLPVSNGQ